ASPLHAIDRPEFALLVRPRVPDRHSVSLEELDVGIAPEKPQQLVNDRPQVQLLRGHQREAFLEIEPHLVTEYAERAGTGALAFLRAVLARVTHHRQVLLHQATPLSPAGPLRYARSSMRAPAMIIGALRT